MSARPIVFGEVLFDVFPDGQRILGGAPFNVAWHLQGFGYDPLFISRVGNDDSAKEIFHRAGEWGLSTAGIQVDDERPTGRVVVRIRGGEPSFEIEPDQAYDFIARPSERITGSVLYHGTLALRSASSRVAVESLGIPPLGVFADLNLRAPWWDRETVDWCLHRAAWIKLNERELHTISGEPADSAEDCLRAGKELAARYRIDNLIVTRGAHGVLGVFADKDVIWQDAPRTPSLVDTVGAGDAFTAVTIVGILEDWRNEIILERAAKFAADICGQKGATANNPTLYRGRFD